jgi:hypothetical protein
MKEIIKNFLFYLITGIATVLLILFFCFLLEKHLEMAGFLPKLKTKQLFGATLAFFDIFVIYNIIKEVINYKTNEND